MSTWIVLLLAVGQIEAVEPSGYFYALETTDGADRLYRIDFDGTVTPIGEPGQLGYPEVAGIVWAGDRLYGFDSLLDVWLQINPTTGRAHSIGQLGAFPWAVWDLAYNPHNGMVYAAAGNNIKVIDPRTGSLEEVLTTYFPAGLTYVDGAVGGINGLYYTRGSGAGGLVLLDLSTMDVLILGGRTPLSISLNWDPVTDTLYDVRTQTYPDVALFVLNQVNGEGTMHTDWSLPFSLQSLTFVPENTPPDPRCAYMVAPEKAAYAATS